MASAQQEYLGFSISLQAFQIGEDICVFCTGGQKPHIGSLSLSQFFTYKEQPSADVSCLSVYTHRDAELGNLLARHITKRYCKNVAVVCRIHYDNLSQEQIKEILAICQNLCEQALQNT